MFINKNYFIIRKCLSFIIIIKKKNSLFLSASDRLRMRQIDANSPADDFDAVMQYHNSMQEKVAQEMMSLVQNLKQNSLLAGHIIRKDTEVSFTLHLFN